ncbi:SsgA family sporulation/cell division regulator [Streptomyces sp. SP17BM10]|uniref:SsgA family sporulation/cell division regulator n=1 Tax=Streptomyces sp. SP17BM10 TaxID=3002530 RepID=UPI002E791CD2|nr:SsgA family sporulation/cell division regulator [Streptomyces sp. SP17BM10]MEE1782608.1 SsgA family sporulation/cell division regulator [Streptomyces sp. SP17BM10]
MTVATCRSTTVTLPEGPFPHVCLEARLRFDASLPYAVCLAFPPVGNEDEVQWFFARDLLNEGRHAPTGHGDVTVAPGPEGRVLVTLRTQDGRAVISIPSDAVTAFLLDSFNLVPAGSESGHLDIDAALDRMLR